MALPVCGVDGRKCALIVAVTAWLTDSWARMSCNILVLVFRPVIFLSLFLTCPQIKLAFGFGALLESGSVVPVNDWLSDIFGVAN